MIDGFIGYIVVDAGLALATHYARNRGASPAVEAQPQVAVQS